ncbi:NAD(P)H-quinone oxidoreductase [Luteimicrobium subarcticum]|uniref:Putative PIG3 family NAD(P)H quinone oxidoreductase n=1 Tax=Luteimicrobium subarcticum TaxID=620910 RepID=A0A2M8W727_9MICO|nr:NAD(P)H-quinone oxidoreductase [Luteimicrobium subarcticum]PJI86735.1 putative PIG3 family NAD(P)H quinone oxidoreductase [Luteimicrobium subarcticum]
MLAVTVRSPGGPEQLVVTEVPDPVAGPDEVVVEVAAAGVNRADLLQRAGHYPSPPGSPSWPGLEVSGTVARAGRDVHGLAVGDRVCALLAGGGYAERVAVPAAQLLPVPDEVDLVDAAGLPEAVCTAWSNLAGPGRLTAGERVLVHGGSGGVGSVAVQLAAAAGCWVATTAGGPDRGARCRELGADLVVDHRAEDFVERVLAATDGDGVDVVLDVLGGPALDRNLAALAVDGRVVVIGLLEGREPATLDLDRLMRRRQTVAATTLRGRPAAQKAAIVAQVAEQVWPWLSDGRLRPVVGARLPLADAADAHRAMAAGEVFGKVLLVP